MVTASRREAPPVYEVMSSFREFCTYVRVEGALDDAGVPTDASALGIVPFQPYPWQEKRLGPLEDWESEVWLKARQLGASTLAQIRALYVAMHMPNQTVLIYSMDQDTAWEFLYDIYRMWWYLPEWLRMPMVVNNKGDKEFANGSRIFTFPSTPNAGSGRTGDLVIVDEAAKAPYARESYQAYRPTLAAGGQMIMMATMKDVTGHFFKEVWEGCKTGRYPYRPVFIGALEVPSRDAAWWEQVCREMPDEEARAMEYPLDETDAFIKARSGLVYGDFNIDRHVVSEWPTTTRKGAPFRWEDAKYRFAGVDFGSSMPNAICLVGVSGTGKLHSPDEFYKVGADPIEMAEWMLDWHKRGRFNQVLCDPSEPSAIATFVRLGLPAFPANNDRAHGIGLVKYVLRQNRWTICDKCVNGIKELGEYREGKRHDPNTRELYPTITPVDHHADWCDGARYAICGWADAEGMSDLFSGKAKLGRVVW